MKILGISAFYHDSAAALISDGKIAAAVQEERFTRKKQDNRFPRMAIKYILDNEGITVSDIDIIVYYEKPFLKFQRIMDSFLFSPPAGRGLFADVVASQLNSKLWISSTIKKELNYKGRIDFIRHHQSHAASAFYPSPFQRAAILTVDGVGEWETTTYGVGADNNIELYKRINFPHSLGLLYAAFTYFTGFKINSGEYKVMGLAPYGAPKYVQKILEHLIDLKADGSFRLNIEYFDYVVGEKMVNDKFEKLFSRPPRAPEARITQDDMDLARSVQEVTELVLLRMARYIRKQTNEKFLCLAGGVALNCVANGKILKERIFEDIWIQPAAGDAGGALGAAFYAWFKTLNNCRDVTSDTGFIQRHSYLGPQYTDEDIREFLDDYRIPHERSQDICEKAAEFLADGKVVGWFSGRMEFGPRALGARSILGDPRLPDMQKNMNLKIKYRESFRPFAPAVLEECAEEWFELGRPSPFMLLVAGVKENKRRPMTHDEQKLFGIDKLNVVRSDISSVTHVDYSARIQTVSRESSGPFYSLLKHFYRKTGCPVLINTSFNVRGEPIVCTPADAYRCFMRTEMDYLILWNMVIDKTKQAQWSEKENWREEFALD